MDFTKASRLIFGLIMAAGFIVLGFFLIEKESITAQIFGYANIIFFGLILLISFARLFQKLISKTNTEQ